MENVLQVNYANTMAMAGLNVSGYLGVWIDYNADGDWSDAGEQVYNQAVTPGTFQVPVQVPWDAARKDTFMRVRLSSDANVTFDGPPTGEAPAWGEVEDYKVTLLAPPLDFGDAPASYQTSGANGANSLYDPNFHLGAWVDYEAAPQIVGIDALGDDNNAGSHRGWDVSPPASGTDDEDGVVFPQQGVDSVLVAGKSNQVQVTVVNTLGKKGYLSAWIDYNGDGDFDDTLGTTSGAVTEEWFRNREYDAGATETLTLNVPWYVGAKTTYVRFRLTEDAIATGDKGYLGPAAGQEPRKGEVEDYQVKIVACNEVDFGDAQGRFITRWTRLRARPTVPRAAGRGTCWMRRSTWATGWTPRRTASPTPRRPATTPMPRPFSRGARETTRTGSRL